VDGQAGERAKFGGEGLGFGGLGAWFSRKVDGVANHDPGDTKPLSQSCKRSEVFSGDARRCASPFQGQHRLGGKAQLVGDSNPDAAVADVKAEIAGNGFQLLAPGCQISA